MSKSETHKESKTTMPGQHMTVVETPFGRLGIAVCYDLRFPELFRALSAQDIQMIAIPSAFTEETGRAHWELLLRARAIENFCYVIGANQTGTHDSGRKTYGHSMIIDPWGDIVARFADGPGVALMTPDLEKLTQIRDRFPALEHRRFNSTFKDA